MPWLLACLALLVAAHAGFQIEAAQAPTSGTSTGTQAKASATAGPTDLGGKIGLAIRLVHTSQCDWPYQYYSDDQLTNIMSLAATKNMISAVSYSKRLAGMEWQVFGCSKSQATLADFTSIFTLECLNDITERNGAEGVNTRFLSDEVEFGLDMAQKMIENTCGTMYGKNAAPYKGKVDVYGYKYKIAVACDIARGIDDTMQTISKVLETFGLSQLAETAANFLADTTKPFVDGCNEVQPKIEEFCNDVAKAGWLSYLYRFLEFRAKIGSALTWVNNLIGVLELAACFGDRANYAQMEATLGITRPSTKCQLAPGQTVPEGQEVYPDPSHCSSALVVPLNGRSSGSRKLRASSAAPLNASSDGSNLDNLGGLGGSSGEAAAARRLLGTTIQPDSSAFSLLETLSSDFSGVYDLYKEVHNAVSPIAQDISDVMSVMRTVMDAIDDFMAPFTPFEGVINTVQNILSYIQCPDLGPLNFICHLGEILDDALKSIMQSVGLPPIDEWLQSLIAELGIPTFGDIKTEFMAEVNNTVMPSVTSALQSFEKAYLGNLKNATSLSYWMGSFEPRFVETGVTLNRAIGEDGTVTISCQDGAYPIVDTATRKLGSCSNEISGRMRYPCKNAATCGVNYAGLDTLCTAASNPAPSDSTTTAILSDFGLSSVPGHDVLLVMFYCVALNSSFGPWPVIRSATPSFSVNYDAGWWGAEATISSTIPNLDFSYDTSNPQAVSNATLQATAAPKIHTLTPSMQVPSMFDTTSSTVGGNLTCPGARQLLISYIQPKSVPKSVANAPDGAWDPCFTSWPTDSSGVTLPSIPTGTPYTAQQLVTLVKQELCFFKWYSTFNTSSPAPWVTDPASWTTVGKSAVTGVRTSTVTLGSQPGRNQEWVATVGSKAGLTAANTRLASGCLGVPESRLEMEVSFDSMADWEAFLSSVPFQEHKAWTQRIQSMVVDGSPVWQVHRSVPLAAASSSSAAAVAAAAGDRAAGVPRASRSSGAGGSSTAGSGNGKLVITDEISLEDIAAWHEQQGSSFSISEQPQRRQPAAVPADDSSDDSSSSDGPRDWKGDPMKLNPGDKLPFKFL